MTDAISRTQSTEIKNSILDSLILIALATGLPNLLILILNTHKEGYFPFLSTAGLCVILLFTVFRKKIPYLIKGWVLISFGYFIGTLGLMREGLLSDGLLYYIFISILSSMLINIRSGIIIMIVGILTTGAITFAISRRYLKYDLDIVSYFNSPGTWLAFMFTATFFTSMCVFIYGRLEKYLVRYIHELTVKTEKLNRSNQRLEIEIEDRQLAEEQLKQSEVKFRNVFNSISDGIILLRHDNSILDTNSGLSKMTGIPKESFLNEHLESAFSDAGSLKGLLEPEIEASTLFNKNEHQLKTSDECITIPVEVILIPFQSDPEITRIALLKDITVVKENEIKIIKAVINTEEEERLRVAQDLHDGIGPYLSAARLYINSMQISESDVKSHQIKKELTELMNLSITSIREISGNLGLHLLRSLGLNAALADYIEKIRPESGIIFSVVIPGDFPFLENVEIALFRVLVELINNSVKYGSPEKVTIKLEDSPVTVTVRYLENGKGFDLQEAVKKHKGMGLYNIRSRISSLGGIIDFRSAPGKGVKVKIKFKRAVACKPA